MNMAATVVAILAFALLIGTVAWAVYELNK
jgi:hypothetical protein